MYKKNEFSKSKSNESKSMFYIKAIVAKMFGLGLIHYSDSDPAVTASVFGLFYLSIGIIGLADALKNQVEERGTGLKIFASFLMSLAGVVTIMNPLAIVTQAYNFVTIYIVASSIISGAVIFGLSILNGKSKNFKLLSLFSGLLMLLLGIGAKLHPEISLNVVAYTSGVLSFCLGVFYFGYGFNIQDEGEVFEIVNIELS